MRRSLRAASEWVKRNVVVIVALDVLLSLSLFAVIETGQSQSNCWVTVLNGIVAHHPPAITPSDIRAAQACDR